ncbi:MAG: hypothetical protein GPJ52_02615 [Candidatus Heimdallarchaeota archaeon]|nr:hypothetical protein [Candidatus Heimdallarchaeota archaeon]
MNTKTRNTFRGLLILLVISTMLLLILTPYAKSIFDGIQIYGFRSFVEFKIYISGNWNQYVHIFGYVEGTETGVYNETGNYYSSILYLCIIGMIMIFIGSIFIGNPIKRFVKSNTQNRKSFFLKLRLFGGISIILGGILGIISMILFNSFRNSVIQPYEAFPIDSIPNINPTFSYFFSVFTFAISIILGIIIIFNSMKMITKNSILPQ